MTDQFPLTFDTCPNLVKKGSLTSLEICGSKRRAAESIILKEIEEGRLRKEAHGGTRVGQAILGDARTIALSVPAILVTYDVCIDCGYEYVTRVDKIKATPQVIPQGLQPMGKG